MKHTPATRHPSPVALDEGESAAISLALGLHARNLLIDESRGRRIATDLGLIVVGTVGVLLDADEKGMLDAPAYFERLCTLTSFYSNDVLRRTFYRVLRERRTQAIEGLRND